MYEEIPLNGEWRYRQTGAVVDYYRRPKQGYYALQIAMQPILPSIAASRPVRLHRHRWVYAEAADFEATLWVVNDTLDEYPKAQLRWGIEEEGGKTLPNNMDDLAMLADALDAEVSVQAWCWRRGTLEKAAELVRCSNVESDYGFRCWKE